MKDIEKMLMGAFLLIAFVTLVVMIPSSDSSDNTGEGGAQATYTNTGWNIDSDTYGQLAIEGGVLHLIDGSAQEGDKPYIFLSINGWNDAGSVNIVDNREKRGEGGAYGNVTVDIYYNTAPGDCQNINVTITKSKTESTRPYYVEQKDDTVQCNLNIMYDLKSNSNPEELMVSNPYGVYCYWNNLKISGSSSCNVKMSIDATIKGRMDVEHFNRVYFGYEEIKTDSLNITSNEVVTDWGKIEVTNNLKISEARTVEFKDNIITVGKEIQMNDLESFALRKDSHWSDDCVLNCDKIVCGAIKSISISSSKIKCGDNSNISINNREFTMSDSEITANSIDFHNGNGFSADDSSVMFGGFTNEITAKNVIFKYYNQISFSSSSYLVIVDNDIATFNGNEITFGHGATVDQKCTKGVIGKLYITGCKESDSSNTSIEGIIKSNGKIIFDAFNYGIMFGEKWSTDPAIEGTSVEIKNTKEICGQTIGAAIKANNILMENIDNPEGGSLTCKSQGTAVAIQATENIDIHNSKIVIKTDGKGIVSGEKGIKIDDVSTVSLQNVNEGVVTLIESKGGVIFNEGSIFVITSDDVKYYDEKGKEVETINDAKVITGSSIEFTNEEPPGPVPPSPPTPPTPPAPPTPTPTPSGGDVIGEYGSLIFIEAIAALVVALLGLMLFIRRK